ncbi:hypothetical protein [Mesomycoplasma hyopneumoniae]
MISPSIFEWVFVSISLIAKSEKLGVFWLVEFWFFTVGSTLCVCEPFCWLSESAQVSDSNL